MNPPKRKNRRRRNPKRSPRQRQKKLSKPPKKVSRINTFSRPFCVEEHVKQISKKEQKRLDQLAFDAALEAENVVVVEEKKPEAVEAKVAEVVEEIDEKKRAANKKKKEQKKAKAAKAAEEAKAAEQVEAEMTPEEKQKQIKEALAKRNAKKGTVGANGEKLLTASGEQEARKNKKGKKVDPGYGR